MSLCARAVVGSKHATAPSAKVIIELFTAVVIFIFFLLFSSNLWHWIFFVSFLSARAVSREPEKRSMQRASFVGKTEVKR
jgi:hypothetical protein